MLFELYSLPWVPYSLKIDLELYWLVNFPRNVPSSATNVAPLSSLHKSAAKAGVGLRNDTPAKVAAMVAKKVFMCSQNKLK